MKRYSKYLIRALSVVFVSLLVIISQLPINALNSNTTRSHEAVLHSIVETDLSKADVTPNGDSYKANISMDFHIDSDNWKSIEELGKQVDIKFPEGIRFDASLETKIFNTDDNLKTGTYHSLDASFIKVTDTGIRFDFSNLNQAPEDFRLNFNVLVTGAVKVLENIDAKAYPIVGPWLTQVVQFVSDSESQKVLDMSVSEENNNVKEETTTLNDFDAGDRTIVKGKINLNIKGNPRARVKLSGTTISDTYPINMASYSETSTSYTIDLFTDLDTAGLGIEYVIELDEASINSITASNKEVAIDFQYFVDGSRVPYEFTYAFPEFIAFHKQTGNSILASAKLADYMTSSFDRVNPQEDDGAFKLVVGETVLDLEGQIGDQYKFQEYISSKLSEYVHEQLDKGITIETVRESLRNGFTVADDQYKITSYSYKQSSKESFEKLQDYPLVIKDFLNTKKDVNESLPVMPANGINSKLDATGFDQIQNGFELKWSGIANTSRKFAIDSLDLNFVAPAIVQSSGISNWGIKTIVNVSYFKILNDGTLVPSTTHSDTTLQVTNTASNKIDPISIPVDGANIVAKYEVVQRYTNTNLNIEVEGKQVGRLTTYVNKTQAGVAAENTKEFPRSLKISGHKSAEGSPTTLIWDVVYNNNKLVRQPEDGFNFNLDTSLFKVSTLDSNGKTYTQLPMSFEDMQRKTTVFVGGKSIEEDGRFEVTWNASYTEATVRIKPGVAIDEEVKFQIQVSIDIKASYGPSNKTLAEELNGTAKLKFDGSADVKSFTNGQLIEPSKPTEEELKNQQATNYLVILDKQPIMVDYRTKEIVWAVRINTVTAYRLGLAGLTYTDKFGDGLKFSPFNDASPILMFKIDASKKPNTSYGQFSSFVSEVKKIMDDRELYADKMPDAILEMMQEKIDPDKEDSKTFNDVIDTVSQSDIAYLFDGSATYTNQPYAISRPSEYAGYLNQLKGHVQNGDGDPYQAPVSKGQMFADKDLRIDFVNSNSSIGGAQDSGDNNAYYILYKTTLESDKPLENVSNSGSLTFAKWIPGQGNTISWGGGEIASSKDLGEVAKYNTVPKKEGVVKVINDAGTNRSRLAVEWTVSLNYDVDTRRVADVPFVIVDTIDKNKDRGTYTLGNGQLKPQEITQLDLWQYTVEKDGALKPTNQRVTVTKASGELVITETADTITYRIEKDMDPQYVYRFTFNTLVESEEADIGQSAGDVASIVATGLFENTVSYTRGSTPGQTDLPEPGVATAQASLGNRNRVSKTGSLTSGTYPGSRQEVLWTLTLNETYETMHDIVIEDQLESKHTFKFIQNPGDLEASDVGSAILDRFTLRELKNGSWVTVDKSKYTLTNLDGREDRTLDNWETGESGFIMKFTEPMKNPIRIQYATFGQVVDNKEIPLKNHADVTYTTDSGRTINHKVTAEVSFKVNDGDGGYTKDLMNVGLQLRYNDNQAASATDLTKGIAIEGNSVENTIVILYRYQKNFVANNHIYRIGRANADGYVEFKNVEEGDYIVKQYDVADGYSVPNSLGYVASNRNTTKDKSVTIDNNQLASGNLVTINVAKPTMGFFGLLGKDASVTKVDYAVFNTTPVFEVKTQGNSLSANGTSSMIGLNDITLNVTDSLSKVATHTSNNQSVFKVGTVNVGDARVDFGDYALTQPQQDLNGYLRNTETVTHSILKNPNGTIDATTLSASFTNYKTSAQLRVVQRGTEILIPNSTYTLEQFNGTEWVAYDSATSTGQKTGNVYEVTNGTLDFHNIDVGRYRLTQTAVGGGYQLNPVKLEFFAYGPEASEFVDNYAGKPEKMMLRFENIKASMTFVNVIDSTRIEGSTFDIKNASGSIVASFTIADKDAGYTLDLAPGDYTLVEKATAQSRPLNQTPLAFTVSSSETVTSDNLVTFINHLGSFTFESHTPGSDTFSVAHFTLSREGTEISSSQTTELVSGTYGVSDVTIDDAWIYVEMSHNITIPTSYTDPETLNQVVHVYGTKAQFDVVNRDGDIRTNLIPLVDAVFGVKESATGTTVPKTGNSETYSNLKPGAYEVSQSVAPQGYGLNTATIDTISVPRSVAQDKVALDTTTHTIDILSLDDVIYYNYRGKVELTKVSAETHEVLAGVIFELYEGSVATGNRYTTDAKGIIYLEHLAPGNYTFVEIQSDGSHIGQPVKLAFTIADSQENAYPVHEITVENYYGDTTFKNTNPNKDVVYMDGTFTLYTKAGTEWVAVDGYINFTANQNTGLFEIFGVKPGTYKLVQTSAPTTTVRNTFEYEFVIPEFMPETSTGRPVFELDDYINYQGSVVIHKVDEQGNPLEGVHFTVKQGSIVIERVTDENGNAMTDTLAPGAYAIQETKPLAGYKTLAKDVVFEIVSEALNQPEAVHVQIVNQKMSPELPTTGLDASTPWLALGMIGMGTMLLFISRKYRNKKHN